MQWIPEYLRKNVTYSNDDQTLYIDLPKNEQISFLQLELSCTNAAYLEVSTLIDAIDSYQVMADGTKVIYNLEPELAYYVDYLTHDGVYPPMGFNYQYALRNTHNFVIPFGRYLYDEEYMLDTAQYQSVQLRIPYDISDTALFNTGTFRANVVMYRPLSKLSPVGFIRSRAFRKQAFTAAVQTVEHSLPMSYPLRYVAGRIEDIDKNIDAGVTAIKVNIDEGRLILADLNINEWLDLDRRRYPLKNGYRIFNGYNSSTVVKAHTNNPYPRAIVSSAPAALFYRNYWAIGEQMGLFLYDQTGTEVASNWSFGVVVNGPNPHKCLTLIDGRKDAFNAPGYSQGKIEYTLAAQIQTVHTFGQEIVRGKLN